MPADDPIRKLALAAVDANSQIDSLLQPTAELDRIAISTLYRFASEPEFELSSELAERLARDRRAQADLERIISKLALVYIPRLAAAASDENRRRETDQAVLMLTPSRGDPSQVYLSIEMKDPEGQRPSVLMVGAAAMDSGRVWHKLPLLPFAGTRTQVMLESDNMVVVALSHPETVIYLR